VALLGTRYWSVSELYRTQNARPYIVWIVVFLGVSFVCLSPAIIQLLHYTVRSSIYATLMLMYRIPFSSMKSRVDNTDPAYHRNVGDHMITLGELALLERKGFGSGTVMSGSGPGKYGAALQCKYCQSGSFVRGCDEVLEKANPSVVARQVAMWHGGGNWGDLWRAAHVPRLDSFPALLRKNYTVVGMPQSLHYGNVELEGKDAATLKEKVSEGLGNLDLDSDDGRAAAHSRVILSWREIESYERAQQLYPYVKNILVPDMAFQLGPYSSLRPPPSSPLAVDIVVFLRDDHESALSNYRDKASVRSALESIEGGRGLQFRIVDWPDTLPIFDTYNYYFSDESIRLLSMGRVVICDRLHAAILCYLAGLPFVYVDQRTGKISKTLRVAFDSWDGCRDGDKSMWARAEDMPSALRTAVEFLDRYGL